MLMEMAVKMLAPQLEKLGGVISDIEKEHGTSKGILMMSNELNEKGELKPVLMVMGLDNGKMHLLIGKDGKPMKYPISELGKIISGGISND